MSRAVHRQCAGSAQAVRIARVPAVLASDSGVLGSVQLPALIRE